MPKECPKEGCFHWVPPGGSADITGTRYPSLAEAIRKGKFTIFPHGGCSAHGKCSRIHPESDEDWFESI